MRMHIHKDKRTTSEAAADQAAALLTDAIEQKGHANFVAATGMSQFDFLDALTAKDSINWSKTTMFHLDEYVGLSDDHKASFRKYLRERFTSEVEPGTIHWIRGDSPDPQEECDRLNEIIGGKTIDVTFLGIGENGHIAFNDPPADFETEDPFIVVDLDRECREQQVGEGWFESVADVPEQAITMSVKQIMSSEANVCTVPGERKAEAVKECFDSDDVSPLRPASILQEHENTDVYLDEASASKLDADHL